MKRIAILQYDWPLQIHTLNLAISLAEEDFTVDLIVSGCSFDLVNLDRVKAHPKITIIDFDFWARRGGRLWRKAGEILHRCYRKIVVRFSPNAVLAPQFLLSFLLLRYKKYCGFIGIEKMGLLWAGWLAGKIRVPLLYFSLELYDEDHPYFLGRPGFRALRRWEKKYHAMAVATIIQDVWRGEYLLISNECTEKRLILLPVSVLGTPIEKKNDFLRRRFGISEGVPIILYVGLIDDARGCLEIVRLVKRTNRNFALVFHGYGEPEFLSLLREVGGDKFYLSTEMVEEEYLPELVASADVGLALYRQDCANDKMTAFSSEKVALYCRGGIPFVAFSDLTYQELLASHTCCELVLTPSEVPTAVDRIMANYEIFRRGAFAAFDAHYCYEKNIKPVVRQISELLKTC